MAAQDAAGARKIARCAPAQRGVIAMELDLDDVADLDTECAAELRGQRDRMASRHLGAKPLSVVAVRLVCHRVPLFRIACHDEVAVNEVYTRLMETTRCPACIVARRPLNSDPTQKSNCRHRVTV